MQIPAKAEWIVNSLIPKKLARRDFPGHNQSSAHSARYLSVTPGRSSRQSERLVRHISSVTSALRGGLMIFLVTH